MLILPLYSKIGKIFGMIRVTIIYMILSMMLCVFIRKMSSNFLLNCFADCLFYFPNVIIGYFFAQNNLFQKNILLFKSKSINILYSIGIISILIVRIFKPSISVLTLDIFYTPILLMCLIEVFELIKEKNIIYILFIQLGKHSLNIWLLHSIIFQDNTKFFFSIYNI